MAYRQPADRRDRSSIDNMTTTSYLEHCLEQVSGLPQRTQEALEQIRVLDDKINTLVIDAQTAGNSAMSRALNKGMPTDNARRSYQEMVTLQRNASAEAEKKISIAESMNETVATIYADVERRLSEFEALLKKDGRWAPANNFLNPTPTTTTSTTAATVTSATATQATTANNHHGTTTNSVTGTGMGIGSGGKNPIVSSSTTRMSGVASGNTLPSKERMSSGANHVSKSKTPKHHNSIPTTRASQKSRLREEEKAVDTDTDGDNHVPHGRSSSRTGPVRTSGRKTSRVNASLLNMTSGSDDDGDVNMDDNDSVSRMDDADDLDFDPDGKLSDAAEGTDNQLYCFCRNVSHGEMIACEATECPYEWFHFECVGLKETPKGQWYCDECLDRMRKKGTGARRHKNISTPT